VAEITKEERSRINISKISLVLASLFFYGLFLERLGYLIVTLLTMIILFWGVGLKRWSSILVASCLTVLITYFLFTYLGVRFPPGILRFLGIG
jgi:signal transduction histidine kinase